MKVPETGDLCIGVVPPNEKKIKNDEQSSVSFQSNERYRDERKLFVPRAFEATAATQEPHLTLHHTRVHFPSRSFDIHAHAPGATRVSVIIPLFSLPYMETHHPGGGT
ncbi:hypothetical protein EYF80_063592 [Liparis tanakae]|uniref:Uncharacterized protein n=1 Tax=Liparis tanakae TaxID=230148 RepID=A0A4Z2ECH9_9TELE|nr:hypothetical protein EYF80_063592 [Liparis tanakae]